MADTGVKAQLNNLPSAGDQPNNNNKSAKAKTSAVVTGRRGQVGKKGEGGTGAGASGSGAATAGTAGSTSGDQHHPHPHVHKKKERKVTVCEEIFATRQLAPKGDRKVYIRYTVRELFVYLIYLAVLCLLTFSVSQTVTYDYSKVLFDLFLDEPIAHAVDEVAASERTFRSSIHILDFWLFMQNVLPHYLFWESMYATSLHGPELEGHDDDDGDGGGGADEHQDFRMFVSQPKHFVRRRFPNESTGILYQNKLLGVARLRQLRIKTTPCPVVRNYRHLRKDECFPPYKTALEYKGIPSLNGSWLSVKEGKEKELDKQKFTQSAWIYRSEKELKGSTHWGKLATYSGGGGVQNLGNTSASTRAIVEELRRTLWIDRSTRAVFLDFTIYNSNLNLFCIVRLTWEFAATGGMTTSWNIRTVRLLRYIDNIDFYLIIPCEILFCLFTLYYFIQEAVELCRLGLKAYLADIWSWVDIGILIISTLCIIFSIYRYELVNHLLLLITHDPTAYADFEFLGYWQITFNNALSICAFISWMKMFKYISFNKTMTQLSSTLSRCAKDIGGFAIMFFVCFFAFAQLGYLLFGSQLEDFSTFQDSILTLLRLILGDFNFRQLESANRILGPIYFLAYVFFVFFVLLNMFLAIINDTYSEVKAEIQAQGNEFEITDYFRGIWNNMRGWFGFRSTQWDAENSVKLAAADGQITYEELREHLKESHFSDVEIEMFLARYELDTVHALDEKETAEMLTRLADDDGGKADDGNNAIFDEENYEYDVDETTTADADWEAWDSWENYKNKPIPEYMLGFKPLHTRIVSLESSLTGFIAKLKLLKSLIEMKETQELVHDAENHE